MDASNNKPTWDPSATTESMYNWNAGDVVDPEAEKLRDLFEWLEKRRRKNTKPKRNHAKLKKRRRIANASKRRNRRK